MPFGRQARTKVREEGRLALVVDDEPFNVDVLVEELEFLGINSVSAPNGRAALEMIDAEKPDIVFLDVMMPELDGFGVLERLKERGSLASLPVIVVSAFDETDRVARCLELGAEDYLTKPFDPTMLGARVKGALEKKRLQDIIARQLEIARAVFGRYVPESVAERILEDKGALAPLETEATMLFCDLQGFTSISESARPSDVLAMLSEYFTAILSPISEFGGVVNQFLGDGLLCSFNVPVESKTHADDAVGAALRIREILSESEFLDRRLSARIGVATGPVIAGNITAADRLQYTVLGDAVNLASRLEELNKSCGTDLLISNSTVERLSQSYSLKDMGEFKIRGRSETTRVYYGI